MTNEIRVRHLLMDVEIAEVSQQIMDANVRMILADLDSVNRTLEELSTTWQGDSAYMFFTLVHPTLFALTEFVNRWGLMSEKFKNEIPAWEEMARRLTGSS